MDDDIEHIIMKIISKYDAWKNNKNEEDALEIERLSDNAKLILGYRFDDLCGLSRISRDVTYYLNNIEFSKKAEECVFQEDRQTDYNIEKLDKVARKLGI